MSVVLRDTQRSKSATRQLHVTWEWEGRGDTHQGLLIHCHFAAKEAGSVLTCGQDARALSMQHGEDDLVVQARDDLSPGRALGVHHSTLVGTLGLECRVKMN